MSLAQIKDQAAHLQLLEQRELIAFLVSIQTDKDEEFRQVLSDKIDDKTPANWLELDDLQKRYAE
jgi:spore coat protein CotH